MNENQNIKRPNYIISKYVLMQDDKFTFNDVLKNVENEIKSQFKIRDEMEEYILNILEKMCELDIIKRTNNYYFPI